VKGGIIRAGEGEQKKKKRPSAYPAVLSNKKTNHGKTQPNTTREKDRKKKEKKGGEAFFPFHTHLNLTLQKERKKSPELHASHGSSEEVAEEGKER